MKLKTTELQGPALDWAVARCLGGSVRLHTYRGEPADQVLVIDWMHDWQELSEFSPSTDWAQGGPIIEREGVGIELWGEKNWFATRVKDLGPAVKDITIYETFGPTPLIAAMRCYVASQLGEEVEVPDEIL
jgi:hypothetical protein